MIAVDAMGGDSAPFEIVKGALIAARKGTKVALFGWQREIQHILDELDASWRETGLVIIDTPDLIEMGEEPATAVRKKPTSSLVEAVKSVKDGFADAVISAGNSGALLAAATLILGRHEGVLRPCIVAFLPSTSGVPVVAADLGASVDAKPEQLFQYAYLASSYAQQMLGLKTIKIGLLSNGSEEGKGSAVTKEAFKLLKEGNPDFIGNVEPEDILKHRVDVVITDGFVGNVLLKTMEATLAATLQLLAREIAGLEKEVDQEALKKIVKKVQMAVCGNTGGALLLGVQGTVVVAHGNSNAETMAAGILFAERSAKCFDKTNALIIQVAKNIRREVVL